MQIWYRVGLQNLTDRVRFLDGMPNNGVVSIAANAPACDAGKHRFESGTTPQTLSQCREWIGSRLQNENMLVRIQSATPTTGLEDCHDKMQDP